MFVIFFCTYLLLKLVFNVYSMLYLSVTIPNIMINLIYYHVMNMNAFSLSINSPKMDYYQTNI